MRGFFSSVLARATPSVILRNINPWLPLFSPVEQPQPPEERGIYSLKYTTIRHPQIFFSYKNKFGYVKFNAYLCGR